jgi:hypothetical protein
MLSNRHLITALIKPDDQSIVNLLNDKGESDTAIRWCL